jgi:phosphohistidine phosphatase
MKENGVRPGLVLCSTARRARETLDGVRSAFDKDTTLDVRPDLYGASVGELVDCLRELDEAVSSVMLIGHNPALGELVVFIAREGPELDRVRTKFPTAALATLSHNGEWSELAGDSTELIDYVVPKDLK